MAGERPSNSIPATILPNAVKHANSTKSGLSNDCAVRAILAVTSSCVGDDEDGQTGATFD